MHKSAPMTFGARLAAHQVTKEDLPWFFNVPAEVLSETTLALAAPSTAHDKIQIGPLDV